MYKRLHIIIKVISLWMIILAYGCGIYSSFVSGIIKENDWPRKRVLITRINNLTGILPDQSIDDITHRFANILKKSGFFNVYRNQIDEMKTIQYIPGKPVDLNLLRFSNDKGINAIIFNTLNPLEIASTKSGMWPFKKEAYTFTATMNVDILDVNNETILMSREIEEEITLPADNSTMEREKFPNSESKKLALHKCLPDLINRAAKITCSSLNQNAWSGKVTAVNEKKITINAGRDAGLRPGVLLEVLGKGEAVTSFNNRIYNLPGPKVGEIKITLIKSNHSFAESVKGNNFKEGQTVIVKK